jgi:putative membrane-bound dehydrogenase-like protein
MKMKFQHRACLPSLVAGVSMLLLLAVCIAATDGNAGRVPATVPATRDSSPPLPDAVSEAKGLDEALTRLHAPTRDSQPLPPREAMTKFSLAPDLAVDLVAAEPEVRQPVNITFDERGRMWVVQYIQYPFPAGLKVVEYDQYIRAKFDKVPLAPPNHVRGADKITIHEDADGDGSFERVKTFVDGLNITTSVLPGDGGVWVLNPPYLLFYPDADRDDRPDGDPVVHLSGFGIEDTHAVANSLVWGPDGWLYGCQGSTTTARVKVHIGGGGDGGTTDFLGQAIWRYHPAARRFEIFAEGGGNTFGLEFDDKGRAYSGTNHRGPRGLHFVQGGYYLKNWGKHGALTNSYAFGFFPHMHHTGKAERLTHTFVVYGGGLLPDRFDGKIIGPNSLLGLMEVSRLEPNGSTFNTVDEDVLMSSADGWFRPVDVKTGPDGAVYVADFYEGRITHVDPRDTWDRSNGRIYRIRPTEWKPGYKLPDLRTVRAEELLALLSHENRWHRWTARHMLIERQEKEIIPALRERLTGGDGQAALESLWALYGLGALDEPTALAALDHRGPFVRSWTVRLLCDFPEKLSSAHAAKLTELAERETHAEVRSQVASSARRLGAEYALPIVTTMLRNESDQKDPLIPMLLWWALERNVESHGEQVLSLMTQPQVWRQPIVRSTIMRRLARRLASDLRPFNQSGLVKLLASAPGPAERAVILAGVNEAFAGRKIAQLSPELTRAIADSGNVELALRSGDIGAHEQIIRYLEQDDEATQAKRIRYIELLGQVGRPEAAQALLTCARSASSHSVRRSALAALGAFEDGGIAAALIEMLPALPPDQDVRATAVNTLISRPQWTLALLERIKSGGVAKTIVGSEQLQRIREYDDEPITALADTVFGRARATNELKARELTRVADVISRGSGSAERGKAIYTARCAACHTMMGEGGKIGPDLTGFERQNTDALLLSIVDPNAFIREEFTQFRVRTNRGQTLVGLITERGPRQITVADAGQKTVVALEDVKEEQGLPTSMMPEDLLAGLGNQDLRDLFKYLQLKK